jgi:hypothetical protein
MSQPQETPDTSNHSPVQTEPTVQADRKLKAEPSEKARPSLSWLKNSSGIAIVASLAAHGLFFAFGPVFSKVSFAAFTNPELGDLTEERTVPLVQLSPAEQNRLPNFSAARFPLSPNGQLPPLNPPGLSSLPPTSGSRFPSPQGQLPGGSRGLPNSRLGGRYGSGSPSFGSPGLPTYRIPAPSGRTRVVRPPAPNSPDLVGRAGTPPSPGANGLPNLPGPNSADGNRPNGDGSGNALDLDSLRNPQPGNNTGNNTNDSAPNTGQASDLEPNSTAGNTPDTSTPDATPPDTSTEDSPSTDTEVAANPDPNAEQQSAINRLIAQYRFDPADTSEGDAASNRSSWLAEAQTKVGEATLQQADVTIPMDANIRLCVDNPPVDAAIGVLVGPDGKRIGDPVLLRSTGYERLNQAALQSIGGQSFEASDAPTAYAINIDVSYDRENCANASEIIGNADQ